MPAIRMKIKLGYLVAAVLVFAFSSFGQSEDAAVHGIVLDPGEGQWLAPAFNLIRLRGEAGCLHRERRWICHVASGWGRYRAKLSAEGFTETDRVLDLTPGTGMVSLQLERVAGTSQQVVVSADVSEIAMASPDPSQRVMVREELLDANPGDRVLRCRFRGCRLRRRRVGSRLPSILCREWRGPWGADWAVHRGRRVPGSEQPVGQCAWQRVCRSEYLCGRSAGQRGTDGGAFNVLEGDHALNMAATYSVRPRLQRFVTLTGDYRDADLTVGWLRRMFARRSGWRWKRTTAMG